MRDRDFVGHDPHDLLGSRLVRSLSFGSRWAGVAWIQLGKRSPVQLRGLLRVPATCNPKAMGLVLSAWARLGDIESDPRAAEKRREDAAGVVEWLARAASRERGLGWGYPFPWANRSFFAPAHTPSSVVTAFVGHGLLDAAERLGLEEAALLAAAAGEFVLRGLQRVPGPRGSFAFSYTPLDRRVVHNANVLAASLLARLSERGLAGDEAADAAQRAARFTLLHQLEDGAWRYGIDRRDDWVDSFHTGYTLISLDTIARSLRWRDADAPLQAGLDYWKGAFLIGPAIGYQPHEPYPVETHAIAQAVLTLSTFRGWDTRAGESARALAGWALRHMRDPSGYFYYRRSRRGVNRLPYMRWVQAWMLYALAELAAW